MPNEGHSACKHCAQPITESEPRWAAREPVKLWHYKCAEAAGLASGDRFKTTIARRSNPR